MTEVQAEQKSFELSPEHLETLISSGISTEVIASRGYRTVTDSKELNRLGFRPAQQRVPGLLIPTHTLDGGNGLYRFRPDNPRNVEDKGNRKQKDGQWKNKLIKYEQPASKSLRLDCNPFSRHLLNRVDVPVFFVEGEKKADSLVSRKQCAVSLPGVWGWKSSKGGNGAVFNDADFDYIAIKGRTGYITFDSDMATNPGVSQAAHRLAEHLRRKGMEVRFIHLPPLENGNKQGVDDYLAAGHTVDELLLLSHEFVRLLSPSFKATTADDLPGIKYGERHLREVSSDALKALLDNNNPPYLFFRSGKLARVLVDKDGPRVDELTPDALRGRLARCSNFYTERQRGETVFFTPIAPPSDVVADLMAAGSWPLPPLTAIVECPSLRPDGTILSRPGYDQQTGLFYSPAPGLETITIPENPSAKQITDARTLLEDTLCDFPFLDQTALANMLGLLLTTMVRPAIPGPVPLALLDAPQAGTGKSLLAQLAGLIATGRYPEIITAPRDEDEWRKRITASLMTGAPAITIDNLTGVLYSGQLAAVLTALSWSDRRLGSTEMVKLPNRAIWMATGNNVQLGGDLPRRCYQVRLDAKMSRPWKRDGFKKKDLLGWAMLNRGDLICAGLTLARAWYASGYPKGSQPTIGGFSQWCHVIGGILEHVGVSGFITNLDEMYDLADTDSPQWESFLLGLSSRFGENPFKVSDICEKMTSDRELVEISPEMLESPLDDKGSIRASFRTRIGKEFSKRFGVRYGESQVRIDRLSYSDRNKAKLWKVICGGAEVSGGDSQPQELLKNDEIKNTELNLKAEETKITSAHLRTSAEQINLLEGEF